MMILKNNLFKFYFINCCIVLTLASCQASHSIDSNKGNSISPNMKSEDLIQKQSNIVESVEQNDILESNEQNNIVKPTEEINTIESNIVDPEQRLQNTADELLDYLDKNPTATFDYLPREKIVSLLKKGISMGIVDSETTSEKILKMLKKYYTKRVTSSKNPGFWDQGWIYSYYLSTYLMAKANGEKF